MTVKEVSQKIRLDNIRDNSSSIIAGVVLGDVHIYHFGENTELINKLLNEISELKEELNHYKKKDRWKLNFFNNLRIAGLNKKVLD